MSPPTRCDAVIRSSTRRWRGTWPRTYGSLAGDVIASGPLRPLGEGMLEVEAQVLYAREHEWALSAEDVLRRRTALAVTGRDSPAVRQRVEELLGS